MKYNLQRLSEEMETQHDYEMICMLEAELRELLDSYETGFANCQDLKKEILGE